MKERAVRDLRAKREQTMNDDRLAPLHPPSPEARALTVAALAREAA